MTMVVGSNTYTRQQQQQQQQQQHQKYLRNEIFGLLSSQKNVVVTFLVLQHTICYILSGMKESPWHMVDVLRPRLFSRFMFLDRKVIKRRQESLIPLTFQEQLSFFSVSRGRNVGGIALELLVEQVKCYVSTNHLLGRHFFLCGRSKSQDISCLFKRCMQIDHPLF